jgi:hypothetical protein
MELAGLRPLRPCGRGATQLYHLRSGGGCRRAPPPAPPRGVAAPPNSTTCAVGRMQAGSAPCTPAGGGPAPSRPPPKPMAASAERGIAACLARRCGSGVPSPTPAAEQETEGVPAAGVPLGSQLSDLGARHAPPADSLGKAVGLGVCRGASAPLPGRARGGARSQLARRRGEQDPPRGGREAEPARNRPPQRRARPAARPRPPRGARGGARSQPPAAGAPHSVVL